MKKFVSLCAFVAALSFVSCGGNTAQNTVDSLKAAADSLVSEATETVDSLGADSVAATVSEAVDSLGAKAAAVLN